MDRFFVDISKEGSSGREAMSLPSDFFPEHAEGGFSEEEKDRGILISVGSGIVRGHLESLHVPIQRALSRELFHFMSEEEFDMQFPDMQGASGRHGEGEGMTIVERGTMGERLLTVLHEMTHEVAVRKSETNPHGDITVAWNGYRMRKRSKNNLGGRELRLHFDALNEAVVEMTAIRLASSSRQEIDQRGIPWREIEHALERRHYRDAVLTMNAIIAGIAGDSEREQLSLWDKIERGQYTGEMQWVSEVDRVFGAGSLRVLDTLSARPKNDAAREKNALILEYFQQRDSEIRTALCAKILG